MSVQMHHQSGMIIGLPQKFEKLKFTDFVQSQSLDSTASSTPSTPASPFITDPYEVEILTPADKDQVLEFLRTFFFKDEPLNEHIGLVKGRETCHELEDFSVKELDNNLSLKAVSNGKIIGVCLNGIVHKGYLDHLDEEMQCGDAKFDKILKLLKRVAFESDVFGKHPDMDKFMTVKILSVDGAWRGRGIAKDLMNRTRELCRQQGCSLMTADCTSHFTAKALKKLGFECMYSLKYEDHKVDGVPVFTPAAPHTEVTVYAQRI